MGVLLVFSGMCKFRSHIPITHFQQTYFIIDNFETNEIELLLHKGKLFKFICFELMDLIAL